MDHGRGFGSIARNDLLKGDDTMPDHRNAERDIAARASANSGNERGMSTLLPMLAAGLILIVVGMIVVMTFV